MSKKTLVHEPKMDELLDELQELRQKRDWQSAERVGQILTELYDKYNPSDNEIEVNDSKIKWKIDPNVGDFGKTKFEVEFNKDLKDDDVEFFIKVNGKTDSFISPPKESGLKANVGLKIKY